MTEKNFDAGHVLSIVTRLHAKMERLQARNIEVQVEGIATAAQLGTHLQAAKLALPGGFENWLEKNYRRIRFGVRQAQRYMVVARIVDQAGGMEAALTNLERLRAMQAALGYKLAELPDGEPASESPRFEQFRFPADPHSIPPAERPLFIARVDQAIERLQTFRAQLAAPTIDTAAAADS